MPAHSPVSSEDAILQLAHLMPLYPESHNQPEPSSVVKIPVELPDRAIGA